MTDTTPAAAPLRPLADSSPAAIVAGFVAMLTGYTSSLVLMFQAGQAAGLTTAQISSWIWALSIGMALTTIGLTLRYRTPIVIAWSTPGAALLISSLPGVPYSEAIGAFIVCAALITLCGVTGSFERLMRQVPSSLASALLAGVLFRICIEICNAAQQQTALVVAMFVSYLVAKRLSPRYAVFAALLVGVALAGFLGLLNFSHFQLEIARPVWTTPSFSLAATISIGIPLFIVAMASQNMPGLAVLRADGYQVPASPLISTTGIASLLLAPFGSHGINLAAISAAICTGPEAHEDPHKRYTAALWCGLFYRHRRHLRRHPGSAVRRAAQGAGAVDRRAGAARLDHERPDQRDGRCAPARGGDGHLHGHRLRFHPVLRGFRLLGIGCRPADTAGTELASFRVRPFC